MISTLTIDNIGNSHSLSYKRNIVELNPEIVKILIAAAKVILVLGTLYFIKIKKIFRDQTNGLDQIWELSYLLMVTPLIFPQQRSYAFLFILPCMAYLIFGFLKNSKLRKTWVLILFGLGVLILNLDLILGHFRAFYWHYKTLTYSVLIMLGLLVWMTPGKILDNEEVSVREK